MTIGVRIINIANEREALRELQNIGVDGAGEKIMAPKAVHRVIKLSGVNTRQANIIKQEMLSRGGEAAVHRGVVVNAVENTDVLLMATRSQYREFLRKLRMQPFGLKKLADEIEKVLSYGEGRAPMDLDCRGRKIRLGERTLVMGILNITPDSFSDGGRWWDMERALEHARQMVADGADIIDLGGESTRPGFRPVPVDEELKRIIPVLERLVREVPVPISIDTTKAEVARQALEAGAHIINDQWGLRADPAMAGVVARYRAPLVLMHNKEGTVYRDLMGEIIAFLAEGMEMAMNAGLPREMIIVDPGIGFGKTLEQNLETMARMDELQALGCPVLLGTSRKSMIGKTLDLPVDERVEGTAATVALGIVKGADIVRVHDVKEMVRVARMTDAMVRR